MPPSPTHSAPTPSSPVDAPLVTVEWRGGLSPQGLCERVIRIAAGGQVIETKPHQSTLGQLSPEVVDTLRFVISRANFVMIESRRFTGTCPMAYDDQETVYTFHLPAGDEVIAACTVAIDANDPLFRAADATIALADTR